MTNSQDNSLRVFSDRKSIHSRSVKITHRANFFLNGEEALLIRQGGDEGKVLCEYQTNEA